MYDPMTLTLEQLESVRSDAFADDLPIDFDKMSHWTEEQAAAYFESGGSDEPPAPAAAPPQLPPPPPPAAHPSESAVAVPITPLGRKPRVALFHGTAGNEAIFKMQLGPLLRVLREAADLHFIDGTMEIDKDNSQAAAVRQYFGDKHVLYEYARPGADERTWRTYEELDTCVERLEAALARLPGGAADVLLGFSQGANLITCLCARGALGQPGAPHPFRAAVILSPTNPGWARQRPDLFASPITTPTIIAYSDTDTQTVTHAGCGPKEVAKLFTPAAVTLHQHSGPGHRPLPGDPSERNAFVEVVMALLARQCPGSFEITPTD